MSAHVSELLGDYALGALLPAERRAAVATHVGECAPCRAELRDIEADYAMLAEWPGQPAPAALRERVLGAIASACRFEHFIDRVATFFDVSGARARELLDALDGVDAWEAGPVAGSRIIHFDGGPAYAGWMTGFVRVAPGVEFPDHRHIGEEVSLIIQGGYRDLDGTVYRRDDVAILPPGSEHRFVSTDGGADLIFAVRIEGGIEADFEV